MTTPEHKEKTTEEKIDDIHKWLEELVPVARQAKAMFEKKAKLVNLLGGKRG